VGLKLKGTRVMTGKCPLSGLSLAGLVASESDKPTGESGKRPIYIAVAVAAIAVVAVILAILVLRPVVTPVEQIVEEGDYIRYHLTGWYQTAEYQIEGYVKITFTDITNTTLVATVTVTGNAPEAVFAGAGVYEYSTEDGIWTSEALTEDLLDDPSYWIGEGNVTTKYGTIEVDIYAKTEAGIYWDYYVAKGTGIPIKANLVTTGFNLVLLIDDTSIEWIKDL